MRLRRIIVENLNSLYGRHEVDLERDLGGESLFLIHGPTGSGKSTLMDAVSLALFGVTPRLTKTGGKDKANAQNVMSRGTGLCSAAVVFSKLEASGRVHYRAEWSTYRANKRADGAFQKVTRTVSRQQASGEWEVLVSDHRNKVYDPVFTQVLEGFEVDDFNRSMLLAQGQFDAFMNAKEGERAKILERLTSTTEYQAIGMKAGVVAKGHRDHINDLKVLADADASLTTEEATALEAEYTEREARQQQAKTAHADALAQQQWMLDAERRMSALSTAKTALQTAEAEGKAFEADSLRVKAHERAEAAGAFTALQESLRLDREVEESRTIIEQIDAQLPGLEAKKNDAAESLQKATAVRDGADGFLRELRPLTNSAHERSQYLGQVRAEAAKAKAELEAATTKYQRQAASIESKQAAMEELRAALTHTRTAFVEALNSLTEAHGAVWTEAVAHAQSAALSEEGFDSAESVDAGQQALKAGLSGLRGQERALRDAIPMLADRQRAQEEVAALEKKATSLEKGRADAVTAAAPLAEKLKVLQATESTLKAALERQKAISEIAAQRSVLKDGEACALCGSTTHPYVESGQLAEEDARIHQLLEQAEAAHEAAVSETQAAQETLRKAQTAVELATSQRREAVEQLQGAKQRLQEASGVVAAALEALGLDITVNDEALRRGIHAVERGIESAEQALAQAGDLRTAYTTVSAEETALSTLREAIAGLKADVDRWQAAVTDAARVEAEAKTAFDTARSALQSCWETGAKAGYGPEHIDPAASLRQRVDAQERHVDTLRAQVERQRTSLSEAERKHADLVSQKTQAVPRLERLVKSQDAATQALQAVLVTLELESAAALQAMRLEPSTLVSLRARQDAISTRLTESSSSVKTCQEALDAHQTRRPQSLPDDASADTVRAQLNSAEAALQAAAESLRETDRQLAVYRDEIKKKAEAKAALEQAISDSQIWMDLNKLIGQKDGERFKLFAQALNLGRLLDKANVHLARLSKRYKLASCLDASGIPTLDFELLDLYQCEARVSARQLSGGERFLVSLALALGLSDFRGIKMPVETLLLDEGFGTLDPDTLSTALGALGQLRADGRQVGIISHVVGLEERIDAQIRVTPVGAGRSTVVASVRG